MKTLIVLVVGLLSVGCLTPEQKLRDSVVGEYEIKKDGDTTRAVFLENGNVESYLNGKKDEEEVKWKISEEGEIHTPASHPFAIAVFRINKDGSITQIAFLYKDGERKDIPKEPPFTWKKIK